MNVSVAANDQTNEDIEKEDNFEKKKEQVKTKKIKIPEVETKIYRKVNDKFSRAHGL